MATRSKAATSKPIAIHDKLLEAIGEVDRPGDFCTCGNRPLVMPGLEVDKLGVVGLPLTKSCARKLIKLCRQAPYGKGTDTVVDTDVRRVWELDPKKFQLTNPKWHDLVALIVDDVKGAMGLGGQKLVSHLYKLLVYEEGSSFLPHRDGEKLDRMVATLVIGLPAVHEGGELVVSHNGRPRKPIASLIWHWSRCGKTALQKVGISATGFPGEAPNRSSCQARLKYNGTPSVLAVNFRFPNQRIPKHTSMSIREELLVAHSRAVADHVAALALNDEERLVELMACMFCDDVDVAQRAAHAVGILGREDPSKLVPWFAELANAMEHPIHQSLRRCSVRYFSEYKNSLPRRLEKRLIDLCLRFLADAQTETAIGVFAMQFVADRVATYPYVREKLIEHLQARLPVASTGYRNRAPKVLKQLGAEP
ncbi:MAG: hypothetical protein R3E01_33650 [Pirellulaceae bacterium]